MKKAKTTEPIIGTEHGDNIANQIVGEDSYGEKGTLNPTDVFRILDAMHSNTMDDGDAELNALLSDFMDVIIKKFDVDF